MPAREPVTALDVLRTALRDRGVIARMRETGHDQVMLIAGRVIAYRYALYLRRREAKRLRVGC